jgi:hypothetical protein
MGAGILPTTIHNGKLYFLFGKENDHEDSAKGFADFGGGQDNNETYFQTAVREGSEELTGFLGGANEIRKKLKKYGTYNIDLKGTYNNKVNIYRAHIFPLEYDESLPYYYNNNQKFIQQKLDPNVIKSTTIFEKAEIRWFCVDELKQMMSRFRSFYRGMIEKIIQQQDDIYKFIERKEKGYHQKRTKTVFKKKRSRKTKKNFLTNYYNFLLKDA